MDIIVTDLFFQELTRFRDHLSPEMFCRAEFNPSVLDPQVYRFLGFATKDDSVETGILQLWSPITTGVCIPQPSGHGRFRGQC